ncbi:hypothetical protein NL676_037542 [Syzygium grande]|nr:hypothetical protein NL676_037542 [Syzygium grande]
MSRATVHGRERDFCKNSRSGAVSGRAPNLEPWSRATRLVDRSGDEQLAMGKQRKMKCLSMADLRPTYGLAAVHGHPGALQIYDESPSRFGGTIVDKPPSPMDAVVVRADHHRP